MNKYRMLFTKTGRAIYISHLDLMHTMQRAFNRAGYAIGYSEGFNPHPLISIALPLSVGMSSMCELMDFSLKEDAILDDMPERLTAAMPEGITVKEVYLVERKASLIKWLAVTGLWEYDNADIQSMAQKLQIYFDSDEIPAEKKSKKGPVLVNIKEGISKLNFEPVNEGVKITAVLSAIDPTINPDLLTAAVRRNAPDLIPDFTRFCRTQIYDEKNEIFR